MRSSQLLAIGTCLLTIVLAPGRLNAQEPIDSYPKFVVQAFTDGCTTSLSKLNQNLRRKICTCTIDKAQSQYSLQEFFQLLEDMQQREKMPPKLEQMLKTCAEKSLLETVLEMPQK
jgi:hypothetical protein